VQVQLALASRSSKGAISAASACFARSHIEPSFRPASRSVLRRRHRTVVTRRARDVVVSASSRHCQARAPGSCGFSGPMGRHTGAGIHCSVPLALTVVVLLLLASVSVSHGIRPAPGKRTATACMIRIHVLPDAHYISDRSSSSFNLMNSCWGEWTGA
jgi:hypothetical protein